MLNGHIVYQINVHYVIITINIITATVNDDDISVGKTDLCAYKNNINCFLTKC